MSNPFMSEIKIISWNFAPKNWAFCNGQLLPINQNQALFSLLGTTYGGNGQTTFGLPDLRGRVPLHVGQGIAQGQVGGETAHTLSISEMPAHNHTVSARSDAANSGTVTNNLWADGGKGLYSQSAPDSAMLPATIGPVGGSQPHNNLSPYLVLNFIICLAGIFPSRN